MKVMHIPIFCIPYTYIIHIFHPFLNLQIKFFIKDNIRTPMFLKSIIAIILRVVVNF